MNRIFAIPAILAAVACSAITGAPSACAADLPEMQVGTRIVSNDAAAPSVETVNETVTEPAAEEADGPAL